MNIFNDLKNAANNLQNQANSLHKTINPQSIQNLKDEHNQIESKINEFKQNIELAKNDYQKSNAIKELTHIRTLIINHYNHLRDGGTPDFCEANKIHPLYKETVNTYPKLNNFLVELEKKYLNCIYGYKNNNGEIVNPEITISDRELSNLKNSLSDSSARCWIINDTSKYI